MAYLYGLQVEDVMFANSPWGIGPKDEELADGTKLNFMRGVQTSLPRSAGMLNYTWSTIEATGNAKRSI
jgi:hypothetical protein